MTLHCAYVCTLLSKYTVVTHKLFQYARLLPQWSLFVRLSVATMIFPTVFLLWKVQTKYELEQVSFCMSPLQTNIIKDTCSGNCLGKNFLH